MLSYLNWCYICFDPNHQQVPFLDRENCVLLGKRREPHLITRTCLYSNYIHKNRKIREPIVLHKTSNNMRLRKRGGARRKAGGNKAMDCPLRRIRACMACASDRSNAIDIVWWNHVHNKLMEGPHPAHSLDANVAHSTNNRSDLSDNAPYVSRAKGTNFVSAARSR